MLFWFLPFFLFFCPVLAYFLPLASTHFLEVRTYQYFIAIFMCLYFLYYLVLQKYSVDKLIAMLESKFSKKYIGLFFAMASFFIISSQVLAYYSVNLNAIDFSIFDWMLASTWQGHFMFDPSVNYFNHFAIHQNYILFLLLPFWKIFESPIYLQIVSALAILSASCILYKISYDQFKQQSISFLLSIFFLTSPYTAVLLNSAFRPEVFYPMAVFLIVFALQKMSYTYLLALAFFLAIKEDAAFYGIGLSFGILFFTTLKSAYKIQMAIVTFLISCIFLTLNVVYIQTYFLHKALVKAPEYLNFWSEFGNSKKEIIQTIFNYPWRTMMHVLQSGWFKFYLPLLFIPLFNPFVLCSSIFGIILLGVANTNSLLYQYGTYYPIVLFSFATIALLQVFQVHIPLLNQTQERYKIKIIAYFILLISPLIGAGWLSLPKINFLLRHNLTQAKTYVFNLNTNLKKTTRIQHSLVPQFEYAVRLMPFKLKNIQENKCSIIVFSTSEKINPYPYTYQFMENILNFYKLKSSEFFVIKKFGEIYVISDIN